MKNNRKQNKEDDDDNKLAPFYPKNKTPRVRFKITRSYEEVKHTDISQRIIIEYDPEWHLVRLSQKGWDGIETGDSFYPKEIKKIAMLLLAMDRVLKEEVDLNNIE